MKINNANDAPFKPLETRSCVCYFVPSETLLYLSASLCFNWREMPCICFQILDWYYFKNINVQGNLVECGRFVMIDSTHKTNCWSWKLTTLYARTRYFTWIPVLQGFLEKETSETIACLLQWGQDLCKKWRPSYVLMDDSNTEAKAVDLAFGGINMGEMEVRYDLYWTYFHRIIKCTVHTIRTFDKRFNTNALRPIYHLMVDAMNSKTRIRATNKIQSAINYEMKDCSLRI
jgi:hypothetical protein